jgi:tetratricopeptide (TPR) repeat protein
MTFSKINNGSGVYSSNQALGPFEHNVSHIDFKVKFIVVPTPTGGFTIQASVSKDNQTYPNVNIKNLPKLDGLKAKEEVIGILKARAIEYINGNLFFLSKDPLETYHNWEKQANQEGDLKEKAEANFRIQFLLETVSNLTKEMKKTPQPYLGEEYVLLGDAYFQLHFYLEAILCYQKSYLAARSAGDPLILGNALGSLGNAYERLGDFKRALQFHEYHLKIAEVLKYEMLIAKIHENISVAHAKLGDNRRAIKHLFHTQKYFEKSKDKKELIKIYNNFGYIYDSQGKFKESIQEYKKILNLTKDSKALGDAYVNIGCAYNSQGSYNDGIDSYKLAAKNYEMAGIQSAAPYAGLGNVYHNLGSYLKSLFNHKKALEIVQYNNERSEEGVVWGNLANAYDALSNVGTVSDVLGDDNVQFSTEQDLRQHYKTLAISSYEESRQIALDLNQSIQFSTATINISDIYYKKRDYTKALEYCLKAKEICEKTQDDTGLASAQKILGQIYKDTGDNKKAEDYFKKSLEIYERTGMRLNNGHIHTHLGLLYKKQKLYQQADDSFSNAINIFSILQKENTANNTQHSISFFETTFHSYRLLEKTRLEQLSSTPSNADHGRIIPISDSGRAQALVSILNKKLGITQSPPITLEQIQSLASRLKTTLVIYSCNPIHLSEGWCWVVSRDGTVTYRNLNLEPIFKELDLKSERPSYLRGTRGIVDDLERPDGSVDASNVAAAISNLLSSVDLENLLSADDIDVRGDPGVEKKPLKQNVTKIWYQALIEPIADLLPEGEGDRVTIMPDSIIHQLPFAVFTDSQNKALIDKYTLITIPSIQTLLKIEELESKQKGHRQHAKACIVANPDNTLEKAEEEGAHAAKLFKDPIFLSKNDATIKSVIAGLPSVGYIHLACHGAVTNSKGIPIKKDKNSVFQGALNLSDGELFADDLIDIPINVDFAILSACDSGKGNVCKEGVVGLSLALLGAGASTVIATKWKVPDAAACEIIKSFYKYYFGETGGSNPVNTGTFAKAEALRKAMLDMKQNCPAHVQKWGGFFLIGLPG